jgi:peptide/nickel transport system ATP-binding protein
MSSAPDPHLAPTAFDGDDLGEPPKVIDPVPGCRFAPRCPLVMDQCLVNQPPMVTLSPTHHAACYAVKQ